MIGRLGGRSLADFVEPKNDFPNRLRAILSQLTADISNRELQTRPPLSHPSLLWHLQEFIFPKETFRMEPTSFTFLNTTGPKLSKPAAKRVRGHVTRANFANRRRQKAETKASETALIHATKDIRSQAPLVHGAWDSLAEALSVATTRTDQYHSAQLRMCLSPIWRVRLLTGHRTVNEFWSVIFLSSRGIPDGPNDRDWLRLLASEPALVEATMSMAVRCWSTDPNCDIRADFHACRATRLLIQSIGCQQAYTDGFLGAAFTMALSERLLKNDEAWEVHMSGIIQAVRGRRERGISSLPSLFTDLVVL